MSDTPQKKTRPARKKSNTGQRIFLFAVVLAIAIAGLYYYYDGLYHVSTDDAYTDGHVITIAPNLSGYVASVHVTDNQKVKAGDILVELVAQDYIIPRDRAVAALALAEAQYAAAKSNYSIAQTTYPAQYAAAKAQRDSARWTGGRRRSSRSTPPARHSGLPPRLLPKRKLTSASPRWSQRI
jgi:membrane fusion protein (multidrug efflux system)